MNLRRTSRCLLVERYLLALITVLMSNFAVADTQSDTQESRFSYGGKGLQYETADGNNFLWFGVRLQTRYSNSGIDHDDEPGIPTEHSSETKLNRGRLKLGGHLFSPRFAVYSEYDFSKEQLLDLRVTFKFAEWLSVRAGQWKSEFNRERVDSSGKQSLVERSISNYWFTLDRQRGIGVSARFNHGNARDMRIWIERVSGMGRGSGSVTDKGLYLARVQWNPAGEQLPFSQSDLMRRKHVVSSIALATVYGDSPYSRFSSSGGGSLPGYSGHDNEIRQYLFETAFHYRGFAWQQELHYKQVKDHDTGMKRKLVGGYLQLGSFLQEWWSGVPRRLELVGRFSMVDPDKKQGSNSQKEWALGLNWFYEGHRNKLTVDLSRLEFNAPNGKISDNRFRFQWELSL